MNILPTHSEIPLQNSLKQRTINNLKMFAFSKYYAEILQITKFASKRIIDIK